MRLLAGLLGTGSLEEPIDVCLLAFFSISCPLLSDTTGLSTAMLFGFSTLLFSSCFSSTFVFLLWSSFIVTTPVVGSSGFWIELVFWLVVVHVLSSISIETNSEERINQRQTTISRWHDREGDVNADLIERMVIPVHHFQIPPKCSIHLEKIMLNNVHLPTF